MFILKKCQLNGLSLVASYGVFSYKEIVKTVLLF